MPDIILKDAEKLWKKVKPMTLAKTGVSESLRFLKQYDRGSVDASTSSDWVKKFTTLTTEMQQFVGDAKIKKHNSAHQWLVELKKQLDKENQHVTKVHDAFTEEAKKEQAAKEAKEVEKQAAAKKEQAAQEAAKQNTEWLKKINVSIQLMQRVQKKWTERMTLMKEMHAKMQAGDDTFDGFDVKTSQAEIAKLQTERAELKKVWGAVAATAKSNSTVSNDVKVAIAAIEKLDDELRADAGGLEKQALDLLESLKAAAQKLEAQEMENFQKQQEELHKARQEMYSDFNVLLRELQGYVTTLQVMNKESDETLQGIDADIQKQAKRGISQMQEAHAYYTKEVDAKQQKRREMKVKWTKKAQNTKAFSKEPNIKDLTAAIQTLIKLDGQLREEGGGKEKQIRVKLEEFAAVIKQRENSPE